MIVINNFGQTASLLVKLATDLVVSRQRQQVTTGDLLLAYMMFPDCEGTVYLNSFGVNRTRIDEIEAQILMAGLLPMQQSGPFTTELTLAFLIASKMPSRFGSQQTTDLQLLAALFCDWNPHSNQIFTITANRRVALDALVELGVDLAAFKGGLLTKLVPTPIRRMAMEES
jgi:hypothetical protein